MIRIISMLGVGLVLFGASAAAAMFMRPAAEETGEEVAKTEKQENSTDLTPVVSEPATVFDENPRAGGVSAETVLRLSESIKKREKQLIDREQDVVSQEKKLKFMIDDLQRERAEITAMIEQAETQTRQSRMMLEQVQQNVVSQPNSSGMQNENSDQKAKPEQTSAEETENLATIAQWIEAMPPEQAADSIRQMCNDGKMDMVVKVISNMEARNVAKIMSALGDAVLVAEILARFKEFQKQQ